MASEKICSILLFCAVILLLRDAPSAIAGDIVHDDDSTPKKPGCENQFVLVYPLYKVLFFSFHFWVSRFFLVLEACMVMEHQNHIFQN